MKKVIWTIIVVILASMCFFALGLGVGAETYLGSIAGKAYINLNNDSYVDDAPANGLIVILYREEREMGEGYMVPVQKAVVEDGEYRFSRIASGEYVVGVRYNDSAIYQLDFNSVSMVNSGNVKVKRGQTAVGPIIILSKSQPGGG